MDPEIERSLAPSIVAATLRALIDGTEQAGLLMPWREANEHDLEQQQAEERNEDDEEENALQPEEERAMLASFPDVTDELNEDELTLVDELSDSDVCQAFDSDAPDEFASLEDRLRFDFEEHVRALEWREFYQRLKIFLANDMDQARAELQEALHEIEMEDEDFDRLFPEWNSDTEDEEDYEYDQEQLDAQMRLFFDDDDDFNAYLLDQEPVAAEGA